MARNIIICSDGTGNTFDQSVSNVTRLIKLLALDTGQEQIVVYDQTNARRLEAIPFSTVSPARPGGPLELLSPGNHTELTGSRGPNGSLAGGGTDASCKTRIQFLASRCAL